jgi:hypothetical protein
MAKDDFLTVTPKAEVQTRANRLNFKQLNNGLGWLVFVISTLVYAMTVERTASFWDCGEFIACSYKLEVPHPPGAPLFLLTGRIFSLLAMGDVSQVAYWINMLSVLTSGFTVLFLFWTITLFGVKLFPERNIKQLSDIQILTLMGAGLVGSLAFAFSDSFWFSAVEAEVYAMSAFFTAFVVWAMLKWELIEDEAAQNRWLIMLAYITGLSIGVHLLNLVTLPALGLIFYYKKFKNPNQWGVFTALAISGALVILILEGVITGLPTIAGNFEIFFVNTLSLPFGSGIIFFVILFLGGLIYGIRYSEKKEIVHLNTGLLSLAFILIGYASYGIILVRAYYNPPINENDPSDIIKFVSYLKREQYGDRPLLYGPSFASDVQRDEQGVPIQVSKGKLYRMAKDKGKYEIYGERKNYVYEDNMLLPRLYSRSDNHRDLYLEKIGKQNEAENQEFKPTMSDNIKFLFSYQFNYMYWRYFFWNFLGRESDVEGAGNLTPANTQSGLPEELANNRGRNNYFALPLLLGLLGLVLMFQRSQQTFFITMMLFFLTGLALVLYLNSPPTEPRERDYIYVGSYYAFTIWIGFGVIFLSDILQRFLGKTQLTPIVATVLSLAIPGIMIAQNWDDHNRSNRYHSVDSAKNLLNSCAPNAILFTGGDNDTFPLWYVQEVEGFRTDVRVCNLSLLGTDWYIDQMKRATYESKPLPISLKQDRYLPGRNDQILYPPAWRINTYLSEEDIKALSESGMDLQTYIQMVSKNDKQITAQIGGKDDEDLTIIPSKKIVYKFNKEDVRKLKFIPADKDSLLKDYITWTLPGNDISKPDLIIMDMIANNQWQRPIYFSTTLGSTSYIGLKEHLQMEGLAYRLMPFKVEKASDGFVNSTIMFENLTKKFFWRELDNPKTYYDENYQRFTLNLRNSFSRLCNQLIQEGKIDKAREAALFCLKKIPDNAIPYDVYTPFLIDILFKVGEEKRAMEMVKLMGRRAEENLNYYVDKNPEQHQITVYSNLKILSQLASILKSEGKAKDAEKYETILTRFENMLR